MADWAGFVNQMGNRNVGSNPTGSLSGTDVKRYLFIEKNADEAISFPNFLTALVVRWYVH